MILRHLTQITSQPSRGPKTAEKILPATHGFRRGISQRALKGVAGTEGWAVPWALAAMSDRWDPGERTGPP